MESVKPSTASLPSEAATEAARAALPPLAHLADRKVGTARLRIQPEGDPDEATVSLPMEAVALLLDVLGEMAKGNTVTVVPTQAELTTHQAAELLNVSRPFLIRLLEGGKIPHRKVGTHRRVRVGDLLAYKKQDDARRDKVLAELTQQSEDLGLGY